MNVKLACITFLLILSQLPGFSQSNVSIDTSVSAVDLINQEFLKGGIEIKNVTHKGNKQTLGLFGYTSSFFPLSSGIILSTGRAADIIGPNHSLKTSGIFHSPGDSILNVISRGWTEDACIIEFDFIPSSENIAFDFVFGSEEYPEYVNSVFNDVFAFIVTNTETNERFNIAYLPTTGESITVNNINHLKNTEFFQDNPAPNILYLMEKQEEVVEKRSRKKQEEIDRYNQSLIKCKTKLCDEIQYDGFTKLITARAKVAPNTTYHFKIGIADVSDAQYDSGVMLRSHSFKSFDNYGRIKGDSSEIVVLPGVTTPLPETNTIPIPEKKVESFYVNLLFDFDSAQLTDEGIHLLDSLGHFFTRKNAQVVLTGHTDGKGSDLYNDRLSYKRSIAVQEKLVSLGIQQEQITIAFKGEKQPVSDNNTEEGRRMNRRVEVNVSYQSKRHE